jgi:signal peptidase I
LSVINKIKKNEYIKSAIVIALIVAVVLGFFIGLRVFLKVELTVVESGSMCVPYVGACDGWSHPFEHTLHTGDIVIIQSVNPADLKLNYPNSDIIVYKDPNDPTGTPIIHRIAERYEINGTLYFQTKGDGNPVDKWPTPISPREYDSNYLWFTGQGVAQDQVEGRVVMRIPWIGWIALIEKGNPLVVPLIIGLIILLMVLEFVIPVVKGKKGKPEEETKNISPQP